MTFLKTGALALSLAFAASCTAPGPEGQNGDAGAKASAPAVVDLRVRKSDDAAYQPVESFTVPASHEIGDGMMPYEGIGWENGLVGYRLYLDGRLVSDIFGKRKSDPALALIEELGSYHDLADWGMDVLKVGPSLGIGGLGLMRNGEPAQFGSVPELGATIGQSGGDTGRFTITAGGIEGAMGETGGFTAEYSIGTKSPMTQVSVKANGALPLASGIVMHDGAEFWQSSGESDGQWAYIATFGAQSENKDGLGLALFYRKDQASYGGLANATHYVAFSQPMFDYGFLAAWELDKSGIKSRDDFEALLQSELNRMESAAE